MKWIGRFILGDFLPLHVMCINGSLVEAAPTTAASYTIYDSSGTVITGADDVKMAPHDKPTRTGWFYAEHRLGSNFSAGRHDVLVEYTVSGSVRTRQFCFEIVAGGHTSGAYIGLEYQASPQARFVVGLPEAGTLEQRKGPSV